MAVGPVLAVSAWYPGGFSPGWEVTWSGDIQVTSTYFYCEGRAMIYPLKSHPNPFYESD